MACGPWIRLCAPTTSPAGAGSHPERPAYLQEVARLPRRQPAGHHHLLGQRHHRLQPRVRQLKLPVEQGRCPAVPSWVLTACWLLPRPGPGAAGHRFGHHVGRVGGIGPHLDDPGGGQHEAPVAAALQPFHKLEGQPGGKEGREGREEGSTGRSIEQQCSRMAALQQS